jgi:hypothetical protein
VRRTGRLLLRVLLIAAIAGAIAAIVLKLRRRGAPEWDASAPPEPAPASRLLHHTARDHGREGAGSAAHPRPRRPIGEAPRPPPPSAARLPSPSRSAGAARLVQREEAAGRVERRRAAASKLAPEARRPPSNRGEPVRPRKLPLNPSPPSNEPEAPPAEAAPSLPPNPEPSGRRSCASPSPPSNPNPPRGSCARPSPPSNPNSEAAPGRGCARTVAATGEPEVAPAAEAAPSRRRRRTRTRGRVAQPTPKLRPEPAAAVEREPGRPRRRSCARGRSVPTGSATSNPAPQSAVPEEGGRWRAAQPRERAARRPASRSPSSVAVIGGAPPATEPSPRQPARPRRRPLPRLRGSARGCRAAPVTPFTGRDAGRTSTRGTSTSTSGSTPSRLSATPRALEVDANLTAGYYNRANARTRAGEYDAPSTTDRALRLTNDADALNNRGMLSPLRGAYELASRTSRWRAGHRLTTRPSWRQSRARAPARGDPRRHSSI